MRAGPLSAPSVIEKLQRDFVNTWVLAKHLPKIAAETEDEFVRKLAEQSYENYLYPVDAQVFSADGELRDHVCANDGPDRARYLKLLESVREDQSPTPRERR